MLNIFLSRIDRTTWGVHAMPGGRRIGTVACPGNVAGKPYHAVRANDRHADPKANHFAELGDAVRFLAQSQSSETETI